MASDFQTICDAISQDLRENVVGLRDTIPHLYAPWDPGELVTRGNERHLAVWPTSEESETSVPLVTAPGGDQLVQTYAVLYWEAAGDDAARGIVDEEAAAELLELHNATRARFYTIANVRIGGTVETRYIGSRLPERSGSVRWFLIGVRTTSDIIAT